MGEGLKIRLVAVGGPECFAQWEGMVGSDPVTIGRSGECTVQLDDPSVSRSHATLVFEDGGVRVRDAGSRGGTSVNMMHLEEDETIRLHDRDLLVVGPWKMLVHIPEDVPPPPAAESRLDESGGGEADSSEVAGGTKADGAEPKGGRGDPLYATRASIFMKLKADGTFDREVGWSEFAEKYSRVIAGFARNAGLKPQEADDVLQDVLLGFFKVSDRFEYDPNKGRFRGYLKRVTLNAIRARHRRKRPTTGYDDSVDPPMECDLDAAWDRQWTEQLLQRAMAEARAEVEARTWKSFELYGVRGVPADEVAKDTGMTAAAIRHAKMRLTRRVREIVERLRDSEG
ncbi:MAG: sigma-70 family RNA polymerase sigma factor [Phycisphaerales bacterium]|jgi:RNA polymerase sigma-70 factor (ECF subfamily)|nr:sigma-70 family RNA polymerase sigma factor [Phycisphaerales bacterium]